MANNNSSTRLGVDIGGTFTDLVLELNKTFFSVKVLTNQLKPEDGIIEGAERICKKADISPRQIEQVIHGTTLATNALIERNGAKTAFITTAGFRDVIEMRTESRFEQYDLNLRMPEPLIPRQQRYTINERLDSSGKTLKCIQTSEVEELIKKLKDHKYKSIAVGLIHSYANNYHEKIIEKIVKKIMPDSMISLSSDVSPQMREYERFNTVVANAYIKPLIKSYLMRLDKKLAEIEINCPTFLMHSGGGIISLEDAAEFPVRLIESGPAGGAVFAAHLATRHNLNKVLSFDMGGTTAKICLIKNKKPKTSRTFEVARSYRFKKGSGMPISIPVIDMVEIGAGGGSIASIDSMKQIRVGPKSAGSEPGPACYGNNGINPTVTDADLLLGKLDAKNFAGGSITLNTKLAVTALKKIETDLKVDRLTAVYGVSEVIDENMANAARVHAVENGEDLSEFTMIAFGGAAPLHAARLCEKLNINRCLIPSGAGVGSAIGFLFAPFSFEANKSLFMTLSQFNTEIAKAVLSELEEETVRFVRSCNKTAKIKSVFKAYMRFSGQGWEIPITISPKEVKNPKSNTLRKLFEDEYKTLFGRTVKGMDVEITVWSVNTETIPKIVKQIEQTRFQKTIASKQKRKVFDASIGKFTLANIFNRNEIRKGDRVTGPAIINEDETTIVLTSTRESIRQSDGCIDMSKADPEEK